MWTSIRSLVEWQVEVVFIQIFIFTTIAIALNEQFKFTA